MTLLLSIALAWLAVAAVVITLCRMAARSDAELSDAIAPPRGHAFLSGVNLFEDAPELAARDLRRASPRASVATPLARS
jgi:hypothetical protein